jgi:hypothetical protein
MEKTIDGGKINGWQNTFLYRPDMKTASSGKDHSAYGNHIPDFKFFRFFRGQWKLQISDCFIHHNSPV